MIQSKFFDASLREVESNTREISLLQNALKEKVVVSIKNKRNPKSTTHKVAKKVEDTFDTPQSVETETFGSISTRPINKTPTDAIDRIDANQVERQKVSENKNSIPSFTDPVERPAPNSAIPENPKIKYNLKKKIITFIKKPIIKVFGILIFLALLSLSLFLVLTKFYGFRFMW